MQLIKTLTLSIFLVFISFSSFAKGGKILLDTEISLWLQNMAKPLLEAASLPPQQVDVFVMLDDDINAFALENRSIYINSGLILKADNEEQVRAVLAHEIGHLKGRHHIKLGSASKGWQASSLASAVVGIGAIIAGAPDAGAAILYGGQAAAISNYLKFSRSQEKQADNIAIELLKSQNKDGTGLMEFFNKLHADELLYRKSAPAYLQTHPLSSERIAAIRPFTNKANANQPASDEFSRIKAKLFAHTNSTGAVVRKYMQDIGKKDYATYAASLSYALKGKYDKSVEYLNILLKHSPKDPFYNELLAMIYIDQGDFENALKYYEIARDNTAPNPLLNLQYGEALTAAGKPKEAITPLLYAKAQLEEWPRAWRSLALAYGKAGEIGNSHLALAKEAVLMQEKADAELHIAIAEKNSNELSSTGLAKLQLLKEDVKDMEAKKR